MLKNNTSLVERDKKQLSRAFAGFVLNKLIDISVVDACSSVTDDYDDCGIDAIFYLNGVLYLVQVKLNTRAFDYEDALKFCDGVTKLLDGDFNHFNANVQRRWSELDSAFDNCSSIKLVIGYTGECITEHAKRVFLDLYSRVIDDEPRLNNEIIEFGSTCVVEKLLEEKALEVVNATLPISKLQLVNEPMPTYFGVVKLIDLVMLHQEKSKALYESNIRYFLGTNNSAVNQSIQRTLKTNKTTFFYLNNGVTALADKVEKKGTKNHTKLRLKGLSVINGAQTISSAAEYVKKFPDDDIGDAKVLLTVIESNTNSDVGRAITKARNHQNPVASSNFIALDPVQEDIRRVLDFLNYSYHYRPEAMPSGAEQNSKVITMDTAMRALAIFSSDYRYPYWLKNEPQRFQLIESTEYAALFKPTPIGSILVNKVNCYRFIKEILSTNDTAGREEGERLFYRHGAYLIASVLAKTLSKLVDTPIVLPLDEIKKIISSPLDECRHICWETAKSAVGTRNSVQAFFRNQSYTVDLLERCMIAVYKLNDNEQIVQIKRAVAVTDGKLNKDNIFSYLVSKSPKIERSSK